MCVCKADYLRPIDTQPHLHGTNNDGYQLFKFASECGLDVISFLRRLILYIFVTYKYNGMTCSGFIPETPHLDLIIPDSLLPRFSGLSLSLLPLPLLIPALPLLLPHSTIILPLLIRPLRCPHTQRASNKPPRNGRRLLRSLIWPAGTSAGRRPIAAQAIRRVIRVLELRGRRGCRRRRIRRVIVRRSGR